MVIVDTSVLIDFLKDRITLQTEKLDNIISNKIPYGINSFIYQEILQGASTEKDFFLLQEYLSTQKFYDFKNGLQSYEMAARMYFRCRKSGVTIRSTIDLLIAETALENDLYLLHNDNDYTLISGVVKDLKIY